MSSGCGDRWAFTERGGGKRGDMDVAGGTFKKKRHYEIPHSGLLLQTLHLFSDLYDETRLYPSNA